MESYRGLSECGYLSFDAICLLILQSQIWAYETKGIHKDISLALGAGLVMNFLLGSSFLFFIKQA